MKKITIAFDVDGTLRDNTRQDIVANEDIRQLLILLSQMKNTKIMVWSGGGEFYAQQIVGAFGLNKYVDICAGKLDAKIKPDIAIDDIHEFDLGTINLIVREK